MPSSYFRKIKKLAKKATKAAGKRYEMSYGRRGLRMSKHSIPKIVKDVEMIKDRLNVEKKLKTGLVQTGSVAQANADLPGFVTHDLTPIWAQGTGESDRVGNSLKLTGFHMKLQIKGQTQTSTTRRLKIQLIKTTRPSTIPLDNIINDMYDPNPLTGFVDYHSDRDYSDNQKTEKVIRTVYFNLTNQGSVWGGDPYVMMCNKTIPVKLDDVLRFESNAVTSPNDCRYFVVIFCDIGNKSGIANTSNLGVMLQDINTGVEYQFHNKFWYVDN